MRTVKSTCKAKGFTLVELLIVLIIIGVLAGMMMLAMGASKDKFTATKIMSNLRTIKSSIAIYQSDTGDSLSERSKDFTILLGSGNSLDKYVSNVPDHYSVERKNGDVYIKYNGTENDGVWEKLANMEEDIGLSVDKSSSPSVMMYLKKNN